MSLRVFVTGATGFLGTELCRTLREQGHDVTGVGSRDGDLRQQESLLRFQSACFERIFHLAAWTQAGDFCLYHTGEQWIINQQINTNVLAWWRDYQPQAKLVAIGTSCSYDPALPLSEGNYLLGQPIDSLYVYAMTKRMLHCGLMALSKQFGLKYLAVVPSTLYGPGYHTDGRQMHFIFDLIRKILRAKHTGESVVLWGDGHQRRELVYVRDFVRFLLGLVDMRDNDLINIGAGEDHSIREFTERICHIVGYDPHLIKYDTTKYVGARSKLLCVEKLNQLLPGRNLTPIDDGLKETIHWMRKAL